jgi:hypothetical protein
MDDFPITATVQTHPGAAAAGFDLESLRQLKNRLQALARLMQDAPASATAGPTLLWMVAPEASTRCFPLPARLVNIGRQPANDLVLDDKEVSRAHCSIHADDGFFHLTDSGSLNGTFVNGRRIDSSHILHAGDAIGIGPFTLYFVNAPLAADYQDSQPLAAKS